MTLTFSLRKYAFVTLENSNFGTQMSKSVFKTFIPCMIVGDSEKQKGPMDEKCN